MDESKNIFILRNALRNTAGTANPRLYEDLKEIVTNIVENALTEDDMSDIMEDIYWKLVGNEISGNQSTRFLGTTTNYPLNFRVNNIKSGYLSSDPNSSTIFGYDANNGRVLNSTVAIGYRAGATLSDPSEYNTMIGNDVAYRADSINHSIILGAFAANNLQNSLSNVIVGNNAAHGLEDEGTNNRLSNSVIIGTDAGKEIINAGGIVAIGHSAAKNFTGITSAPIIGLTADQNKGSVFIGQQAGEASTGAAASVVIGALAGKTNTNADGDTLIGCSAGENKSCLNAWFYPNTAVGIGALRGGETAPLTPATGWEGTCNVGIGCAAGLNNKYGWGNTYVGYLAGQEHGNSDIVPDTYNFSNNCVYIGEGAGRETIQDIYSVLIGFRAGEAQGAAMGGSGLNGSNTAIGNYAMAYKKGIGNIAIGQSALRGDTQGENDYIVGNIAIGPSSLYNVITGSDNIGVGGSSLVNFVSGNGNVANGTSCLAGLTEGNYNLAAGHGAGMSLNEGNENVIIGKFADVETNVSNSVAVGAHASAKGSWDVSIGRASTTEGPYAVSIGVDSNVDGNLSISLGYNNEVIGSNSIAIGSNLSVTGDNILALGTTSHSVGIGTTVPSAKSALDITSTTKGFLPPRMTTVQRDAIATPPAGLMLFNTTDTKLQCYDGAVWQNAW